MIPYKTIEKIAAKNVIFKNTKYEKLICFLKLAIAADGSKLPALLNFKSKAGKTLEKKL